MQNKRDNKIIIVPILIFLVFIFSIIGFSQLSGNEFSWPGVIYATLSFFTLENVKPEEVINNPFLMIARYLAAAILGLGIYSLFYKYISRQYTRLKIKYGYKNHVVVFSMKMVGPNFLADLLANNYIVILVEDDEDNPYLEKIEKDGIIVFKAKDFGTKLFDTTNIAHASTCVVAYGDDSLNIELSLKIVKHLQAKGLKHNVKTLTHIKDRDNLEVLKDYIDMNNVDDLFEVDIFNTYSAAAKKIYDHYAPHNYFNFADDLDENAIAVIGYSETAEDFILENLILSHYKDCKNIKLYVVDKDADVIVFNFMYKYPFSREFIDIIPVKLLNNKFFANFNWSKELIEKLSKVKAVYFFGDSGAELMNLAARFRQFLSGQTMNYLKTPIIICHPEDIDIMNLLDAERGSKEKLSNVFKNQLNISFVNMITDTCTSSRLLEESEYIDLLSRIINYYYSIKYEFDWVMKEKLQVTETHALIKSIEKKLHSLADKNVALSEHEVEHLVLQTMADYTKKSVAELKPLFSIKKWWDQLSHHKKSANRYAARHLSVKITIMKHIGCYPLSHENILNSFPVIAPIEHKRWSAEKMALNYRYGVLPQDRVAKNIAKDIVKIHDQLIPYDKLDDENKEKDLNIFLLMPLLNSLKVEIKK
ncbi:MAG: hypothetical protein JWQ38_1158 [Flavipsychrobacter sp.]|nr:hypothetical protein [Flavipsychrobacter sp.]